MTMHWVPNRLASLLIKSGLSIAGVFIEILSAPYLRTSSASSIDLIPPATQNGILIISATRLIHDLSTDRPSGLAVIS